VPVSSGEALSGGLSQTASAALGGDHLGKTERLVESSVIGVAGQDQALSPLNNNNNPGSPSLFGKTTDSPLGTLPGSASPRTMNGNAMTPAGQQRAGGPAPNVNAATMSNTPNSTKQCAGCGAKIVDRFLLHAMDRYWHTGCLKCSCCQAHLGEIGSTCFTKAGMILCKNDYIRMFGTSGQCAACGQQIPASELVMKAQGNAYHLNCFTCVTCHNRLVPGDRFSIVNGSLICEQDYPKVVRGQQHSQVPLRPSHKVRRTAVC